MDYGGSDRPTAELINIIKDLFYNASGENTEERDRIIKKVEHQFQECDANIDQYIRRSSKDLSRLIKVFNEIAKKIESSREKVSHSREALKQCKILLQSKRDDVRRLWLEWCEQKFYYENISKLKHLYASGENIRSLCAEKKYLEAAELIAECSSMLDTQFHEIPALHDIKRNLETERIKLQNHLLAETTEQLFHSVTRDVLETGTVAPNREASFKSRCREKILKGTQKNEDETGSDSRLQSNAQSSFQQDQSPSSIIESLIKAAAKLSISEANVNVIDKIIGEINRKMTNELIIMINATSTHVLESNLIDNSKFYSSNRNKSGYRPPVENNPKFLVQLIDLAFEQFKICAKNYREFILHATRLNQSKYQTNTVWTCIQSVLIQLLEEYLDIKLMNGQNYLSNTTDVDKIDINSFFVRKRLFGNFGDNNNPNQANPAIRGESITGEILMGQNDDVSRIFTFKNSMHAMSIQKFIKEKNNEDLFDDNLNGEDGTGDDMRSSYHNEQRVFKILVCQPDHRNITSIFATMEQVIKETADEMRTNEMQMTNSQQQQQPSVKLELSLDKFLQDFILHTFITNAVESIKENAKIHSTGVDGKFEIAKQLIPLSKQRELGLNKPILMNIYMVHQSCVDFKELINDMSSYASEFTKAMHNLIEKHSDYCNKLFLSIVTNTSVVNQVTSENYVYSMVWVMDEGIKQYFKQLPSFSSAIKGKPSAAAILAAANSNNSSANHANGDNPALLAANVEIEQFNIEILSKEVDTLISNVTDKELEEIDIITNFKYIEMVAHLHESCDWLIIQLKYIVNSLEQMIKNPKSLTSSLPKGELTKFTKQLDDLDKWRGDTLLLLYLETRVHCFYHLMSFIKQENNTSYAGDLDTDPDDCVLNMNRDLHRIYEHLTRSLQESKVNYVFDALGFMIATIFIKAVKNFKKISKHGIAKMCRNIFHVEQNLSAIRMKSDPHLMKAHRFYELLYKKPEELLNHLIEHEAEFQLSDYTNLLNLIYRSKPGDEIHSLADNIQSLQNILKNKH